MCNWKLRFTSSALSYLLFATLETLFQVSVFAGMCIATDFVNIKNVVGIYVVTQVIMKSST
jgi:hypothetical protein